MERGVCGRRLVSRPFQPSQVKTGGPKDVLTTIHVCWHTLTASGASKALGCLNDIDTTGAAELLARHQLTGDQPTAGRDSFPANAAGLFWVSDPFFVIEDTWAVLFSLQALGKLDAIDGQACVAGLMRCYRGKGDFTGGCNSGKAGNPELVQSDAYHALESLVMLGALDKVSDLEEWSFRANWCQDRNGKLVAPFVTPAGIEAWARQSRLDELRTGDAASAAGQ